MTSAKEIKILMLKEEYKKHLERFEKPSQYDRTIQEMSIQELNLAAGIYKEIIEDLELILKDE